MKFAMTALVLLYAWFLIGCSEDGGNDVVGPGSGGNGEDTTISIESIALSDVPTADFSVGEKGTIGATTSPSNHTSGAIVWSSSDETIVSISDKGEYEVLDLGTVTITATVGSVSKSATVKVTKSPAQSIVIEGLIESGVGIASSGTLTAVVTPSNHTSGNVTWSSSDISVVSIDQSGVYIALNLGTATIKAEVGGVSKEVEFKVVKIASSINLGRDLSLTPSATGTLTPSVSPADYENGPIVWTVGDSSIITIDADGNYEAKKLGNTTIKATIGEISNTIQVEVNNKAAIAGSANLTTDITSWNSGNAAANLARVTDGNVDTDGANDYQIHPTNSDGKHITFTWSSAYQNGTLSFYNRVGCCTDRIVGSTLEFKLSGSVTHTHTFSKTDAVIEVSPPANVKFDEIKLTFSGGSQNFREIEVEAEQAP